MLRRLVPVLLTVSLGAIPLGCMRAGAPGPASPQPIRDEKEPGESFDTVSAVPDSGSTGVEDMTSGSSENEVEIDEGDSAGSSAGGDGKEGEKSAGKSDDQAGDGDGDEDETGDEPDDPTDPGDIDVGSEDP
jgi:hypothetical protein